MTAPAYPADELLAPCPACGRMLPVEEACPTCEPPPGSDLAVERGCRCPAGDNGRGRGFQLDERCPLHAGSARRAKA